MRKRSLLVALLLVCAVSAHAAVTVESVGDPYSFGRDQTYLGLALAPLFLRDDCTGFPPEDGACVELNPAPAATSVDEPDLAVIELPGKVTNSLICFTVTPFATWDWYNATGSTQTASMFLRPVVRVESDVVADPSLINGVTGLPFNGVLTEGPISTFVQSRSLDPGESDYQYRATSRGCTGGLVSRQMLTDVGLSNRLIKEVFKQPMLVTIGVQGSVSMVTQCSYRVGVRLYGD